MAAMGLHGHNRLAGYVAWPGIFAINLIVMAIPAPFNLHQWIDEHRDLLKPPVGNKNLYPLGQDFIVMVVGGPNARKDYHYNESEEWFYQVEGEICVRIQEEGKPHDVIIRQGETFLLPKCVPHSPSRGANTVGLVIERVRKGTTLMDGLMWFCENCNHKLHEYRFALDNIEKDFIPRFREFYGSEALRTCGQCGHVMEADRRFA
jgi:3-hydroxyanthranilate 3,4-dioxygenase